MIGSRLGQFQIVEELGAGAMGVVYRARDERLHRDVALKRLPPGALSSDSARRLFHREALALSRLNHPGIATVYDFQTVDGVDFLVMEYVAGESLDRRIARGPLPPGEVVSIGLQLAEALDAAHRAGVVHRDLKPANLRFTSEGRVKILDFGLAQWRSREGEQVSTETAAPSVGVPGTPAYLAPELLDGARAGERTDLWAAGIVLYEAATGSRPFPGLPAGALLAAIRTRPIPAPRSKQDGIPPELEAVILHCLERDPGRRYASAAGLAEDLRRLQSGGHVAPRPLRRPSTRFVALALAALVVLSLATWLLASGRVPWFARDPRAATIRSLAVLPLSNLSGDAEQDFVADAMTEELIVQLSKVRSLRVISFSSVMRYRKSRPAMPVIARELGADGVIEGSVQIEGGRLRTTVSLVDALEDAPLWSGHYTGDTTDVLRLQSRAARAIVKEIQLHLTPAERARLAGKPAIDPEAYQLYLHGRYQWGKRNDAAIRLALADFQQAVRKDSTVALFHAGLADAWAACGLYGLVPPDEAAGKARAAAERAVALDPDLSEAHTSLAGVLQNFEWDWRGAEQEYLRAIDLNPNNAVAHQWYGNLLTQTGRFAAAREELRDARELDPFSIAVVLASGVNEYAARRYDVALEQCRRAMEIDSTHFSLHRTLAAVYDRLGREDEAVAQLLLAFEVHGDAPMVPALRRAYRDGGVRALLALVIEGLKRKRAAGQYESAEHVAELYARLGQVEPAFEWLETAFREHDPELNRLGVDPIFDPLRRDARFATMLRRLGLDAFPLPPS